jgi:hypothetical protein
MTDTEPAPATEGTGVPLVPAHRAGAGLPAPAIEAARSAGWAVTDDPDGNVRAVSDDGELQLGFLPETDTGPLWTITCTAHPAWEITADDNTPAEFLAVLITAITTTGPLDPDRDRG